MKPKYNTYDYLIVLLIVILLFGQVFQLIKIVGLVAGIYVLSNFKKEYYRGYTGIKIFLSLFIVFNFTSLLWSHNEELWKINLINLVSSSFNFMLFVTLASKANSPVRSIIYGWVILIASTVPIALWEFSSNLHLSSVYANREVYIHGDLTMSKKFAATTFGNMNSYTTLLVLSVPIISSLIFSKLKLWGRIFIIALLLSIAYIIITNSSRGGVLSLAATTFVFSCFYLKHQRKSFWGVLLGLAIILIAYYNVDSVFYQFEQRLIAKGEIIVDEGRSNMLQYGLDIFINNPLGIGVGEIAYHYSQYRTNGLLIPHNMFIEFLLYGGFFFFSAFILWLMKIYNRAIKSDIIVVRYISWATLSLILPAAVINSGYFLIPFIWIFLASIYVISNAKINDNRLF